MGVFQYLDLSTGHVQEDTMAILSSGVRPAHWPIMTIAPYEHGAFISVPDDNGIRQARASALIGTFPEELAAVLVHAANRGCHVVRFDSSGSLLHALEVFQW